MKMKMKMDEDALTTLLLIGPLTRTAKEKKRLHDAGGGSKSGRTAPLSGQTGALQANINR